jgi:ribosomal protein S18 acetylase RimI-like enzyme
MEIRNSTIEDIDEIFRFYRVATAYMQTKSSVSWPEFERSLVETEIKENHQWKMMTGKTIACVWATTYNDPLIWEERNDDPAVYIHRIATNPDYRGKNLVVQIMEWAKAYAKANGKKYIRLDTVGENKGLIRHYQNCGFNFLGLSKLKNTKGLPLHYENASVSLFELPVNSFAK